MEPVQSKNSQAISGADDSYYPKKKGIMDPFHAFSFPDYKRFTNLSVLMAVLGRPCSRSQPMHASTPLEHPRPAATAGHSLTIQPCSR